jgi:hypothetical protein
VLFVPSWFHRFFTPEPLMTANQLDLYNGALRLAGERKLASLTEAREPRFLLDDAWGDGGAVAINAMLEQGLWHFAKRTARLDADPNFVPLFGYRRRFEKPNDWVRTAAVAQDEYLEVPLTHVSDEAGSWFADLTPIYVMYVSNDPAYGNNLAAWPPSFALAMEAYLASKIAPKLTTSKDRVDAIEKEYRRLLLDARSKAAMAESAAFLPLGTWVRGRWGRRSTLDRGNPNSLIG